MNNEPHDTFEPRPFQELKTYTPPRYRWFAWEVYGAHLVETLEAAQEDGKEVFSILPSKRPEMYVVVSRQPIEEDESGS